MALSKRRLGRTRIHHRRSSWSRNAASNPAVQSCPSCGEPKLAHRVCLKCGVYDGEKVVDIATADEE